MIRHLSLYKKYATIVNPSPIHSTQVIHWTAGTKHSGKLCIARGIIGTNAVRTRNTAKSSTTQRKGSYSPSFKTTHIPAIPAETHRTENVMLFRKITPLHFGVSAFTVSICGRSQCALTAHRQKTVGILPHYLVRASSSVWPSSASIKMSHFFSRRSYVSRFSGFGLYMVDLRKLRRCVCHGIPNTISVASHDCSAKAGCILGLLHGNYFSSHDIRLDLTPQRTERTSSKRANLCDLYTGKLLYIGNNFCNITLQELLKRPNDVALCMS